MSVSAGSLPSTLLDPVDDALATAAGVAVEDGAGVGFAVGSAVGEAVGVTVGVPVGAALGVAVATGVEDGLGVAEATAEAVGAGEALGAAVIDATGEGEAVGRAPPPTGASDTEPLPLQAVKIAAKAQITNAARQRGAKNEYIVDLSEARSKYLCRDAFNAAGSPFCERSYT